jgi:dTDP-4-amino-4,6-dideoxygalactose transaminase
MDFDLARRALSDKTKAIVTIDQLGAVTRAADIQTLESETGVPVISDAACGLGGQDQDGKPAGSAGRYATFSFHPRKVITTGEGGAVACDDEEVATQLRALRNHGQIGGGRFSEPGTNARLGEVSCAIGSAQMARLQSMLIERRMLVDGYKQRLQPLVASRDLRYQVLPKGAVHANQTFAVLLSASHKRQEVISQLSERGIASGAATYSFLDIEIHKGTEAVPNARLLHNNALALPLYLGMRSAELDRVCDALKGALQ